MKKRRVRRKQQEIKTPQVQQAENVISKQNSRSTTATEFWNYLKARFKVQDLLYSHYRNLLFRIHSWWSFRKKKSTEQKLVNNIKEKFGEDVVLAYGTWTRSSQMKRLIPSPISGIKKVLTQHFTVIDTCEYRTTKLCSKCHTGIMVPVKTRTVTKRKDTEQIQYQLDVRVAPL